MSFLKYFLFCFVLLFTIPVLIVSYYQETLRTNELLKALYGSFYERLPARQLKAEIKSSRQTLTKRLDKFNHSLVLQIIDCKDQIAEDLPIDSFITGFCLARKFIRTP